MKQIKKQIKTAICDDEIFLLPQLTAMIKNLFRSYHLDSDPDTFDSAAGLLNQIYQSVSYDVYFLDIDLPGQEQKKSRSKTRMLWLSSFPQRKSAYMKASTSSRSHLSVNPIFPRTCLRLWKFW